MNAAKQVEGKFDINVKRFYLPVVLEVQCPKCGSNATRDFGDEYLSYPFLNTEMNEYIICDECEHEFSLLIELKMFVNYKIRNEDG